jgi:hypothetical protein
VERIARFNVIPEQFQPSEPVPYGEPYFNQLVAERFGLSLPAPPDEFLPRLPYRLRKRSVEMLSAGEARKVAGPVFLKPPTVKSFPAQVFPSGAELPEMPDTDPVLVQEVVEWDCEYRFFFVDGRPYTGSNYMHRGEFTEDSGYQGDPSEYQQIATWAESFQNEIEMPHAVVIDIGIIKGRGMAIIEANEACGSGLYGCDPLRTLDCLYYAVHRKRIPGVNDEGTVEESGTSSA